MSPEDRILKGMCEKDFMFFMRYIYKENNNRNFIPADHLKKIAELVKDIIEGKVSRAIINIPPRYGKTETLVKGLMSYGLALNNASKFIHLSYSDDLALDNSSQTKEYVQSEAFQKFWSMTLKKDAQGKKKWFNEFGGGVYATSTGGQITGFGAGVAGSDTFSGAIIIDDPLKPDDALSEVKRKAVNARYNNTIRSRVNDLTTDNKQFKTPIIVIMQRLHEEDLSGYLIDGGSGEDWFNLCLPALDKNNNPLWEDKHTFEELEQIRQADKYTFAGQYMQKPAPEEGLEWKKDWFEIVNKSELPQINFNMYIDGAYTKNNSNDPTGLQVGCSYKNDYYILSSIDKYLEMPELIKFIPEYIKSLGVRIRMVKIEPKASGKSIKQILKQQTKLNVSEIKTDFVSMSKIERARSASPYIESGRVKLIKGSWNENFLNQVSMFPNAKHDEHVDLTSYAIENELIRSSNSIKIKV